MPMLRKIWSDWGNSSGTRKSGRAQIINFASGLNGIIPKDWTPSRVRGEFLWLWVMGDGNSTFFLVSQGWLAPLCGSIIYVEASQESPKSSRGTWVFFLTKRDGHLVFSSASAAGAAGAMESKGQEGAGTQGSLSVSPTPHPPADFSTSVIVVLILLPPNFKPYSHFWTELPLSTLNSQQLLCFLDSSFILIPFLSSPVPWAGATPPPVSRFPFPCFCPL